MTVPGADWSTDGLQRAAGYIAARRRGDHVGAAAVWSGFSSEGERVACFAGLADLTVVLLARSDSATVESTLERICLAVAASDPDR